MLFLLSLPTLALWGPRAAHAIPNATNVISDPNFEQGSTTCSQVPQQCPVGWDFETCEGVSNAVVTLDSSQWTDGGSSGKVSTGPITSTGCFPGDYSNRAVGFSQFRAKLIGGLGYNFTTLTDDPAALSFWFQLQPYDTATGMAAFEVRIFGAEGLAELDYVFNADPSVGAFQNNTSTHSLLFTGYQYGTWYHFSRNLRADWMTPMGPANAPLNLDHNFTLVQFQGFATKSGSTIKSETFWIDDIRAYQGSGPIPSDKYYTFFSFTDITGNNADSIVKWTLENATGAPVQYTVATPPSVTLTPGPYYVSVYYQTINPISLILTQEVHLNQSSLIPLPLYNTDSIVPGGIIALNSFVTSLQVNPVDNTTKIISIQGTSATNYAMIVKVPIKPVIIQANGQTLTLGTDWTYDNALSIARMSFTTNNSGRENVTILFQNPTLIPSLSFLDATGARVDSIITFAILDSKGKAVSYNPGSALSMGTYYVEAYYEGFRIYRNNLSNLSCSTCKITLEMSPLDSSGTNYLALNSTATAILPTEFSSTRLSFSITGQGPYLIIFKVPKRPLFVEEDGIRTPNWVYDNTTNTVAIQAARQGTFLVALEQNSPDISLYVITGVSLVVGAATVLAAWVLIRKRQGRVSPTMIPKPQPRTPR